MIEPDDATLLAAWAEGDNAAGDQLLARYFSRLLAFFGARAEADVEDLVQRTMLSCVRARASLQQHSSFRAFLFRIARNELIDDHRRKRHERAPVEPDEVACERTTPSQFAIDREQRRLLARALYSLDLELQVVLALHYWEGMASAELADALGIPIGTVKSRIRRGKEALHRRLLEHGTPDDAHSTLASLRRWAEDIRSSPT